MSDPEDNEAFLQGLLAEYIDNSLESLVYVQELIHRLTTEPGHKETVKEIFRMMHSLKASSTIVGCLPVRSLAHATEFMLEKMSKGLVRTEKETIDILTTTTSMLIVLVETFGSGQAVSELTEEKVKQLVKELDEKSNSDPTQDIYRELFEKGLFEELKETIANAAIEDSEKKLQRVITLVRRLCGVKDTGGTIIESGLLIDVLRDLEDDTAFTELMYEQIMQEFTKAKETTGDKRLLEKYQTTLATITELYEMNGPTEFLAGIIVDNYDQIEALRQKIADESSAKIDVVREKTMRVPESSLDEFIRFIGDLIIVREMIDNSRRRIEPEISSTALNLELKRHVDNFSMTLSRLEASALEIRKQSVNGLMNKMSRLAREVAAKTSKIIIMNNEGNDVRVDKSLLELIEAPIIHMVSNAVDHGIEPPEERERSGKPPEGLVSIKAREEEENIILTVADDGRGMNFDILLEKGQKMGLANDQSSFEELLNLIFVPGFSTVTTVSDISGRGVGMDVVKKELEKVGGSIAIQSEKGIGSTFTLTLPKSITTQIIQGYIIEVAGEPFIIPVKCVRESLNPAKTKVTRMYDSIECLELRGEIMPVIKVAEHLYNEQKNRSENVYVIVEETGRNYALYVDKVIGIQQVVLKELQGMKIYKNIFTGAALMGNGDVALVLDVSAFLSTSTVIPKGGQA